MPDIFQARAHECYQSHVPGKLVLFGEWAVLKKSPAIVTSVESRFFLTAFRVDETSSFGVISDHFSYQCDHLKTATPPPYLKLCFQYLNFIVKKIQLPQSSFEGLKIELLRQWPLNYGLGSSSALFILLYQLCLYLKTEKIAPLTKENYQQARELLIEFQKNGSGIDLLAQYHGKSLVFQKQSIDEISLEQPQNLFVVHTHKKAKTGQLLQSKTMSKHFIEGITHSTEAFLEKRNWVESINEHYHLLQKHGVVPDFVQELRESWTKRSFIKALKTTGAGGGDSLLIWVEEKYLKEWKLEITDLGWTLSPHPWSSQGFYEKTYD